MLFSWSGQPETSIDVFWWHGLEGWLNQHVFRVTPAECVDRTFFYYLLRYLRPNFVGIARNKQTTGLGHVTKRDLENIEVGYPGIQEQQAIACILGALDDKIELNRQRNTTLEATARAIFKSWFVDFDPVRAKATGQQPLGLKPEIAAFFPNAFEDSDFGEIPKGWRLLQLDEVCELAYGRALKASERKPGPVAVMGSNGQVGWHDSALVKGPGLIVGRKGNPGIVTWVHHDFYPIDTTFYVVPATKTMPLTYLFEAIARLGLPRLSADSAVPGLNRNIAYMSRILVPSPKVLAVFDQQVTPLAQRGFRADEQNRTLADVRDALLPRLISGELPIREAERVAGRCA